MRRWLRWFPMTGSDLKGRPGGRQAAEKRPATALHALTHEGEGAVISRRAADRLRAGHVWVYRSDVVEIPDDAPLLLPVLDQRRILLGTALYSPASEIALRLVSTELTTEAKWLELLGTRLHAAIAQRKEILSSTDTNACRLIFSEVDALPGVIVDKYGELVILQLLVKALDNEAVRIVVAQVLRDALAPATIVERPDPRIRELEQ